VIHIIGAGGMARDLAQEIWQTDPQAIEEQCKFYVEPEHYNLNQDRSDDFLWCNFPVSIDRLPGEEVMDSLDFQVSDRVFVAIGDPKTRLRICQTHGINHAENIFIEDVYIGNNVQFGECGIFLAHTSIGHDSVIGDFVTMMPGSRVSGNCKIGDGVLIGANATILPGVKVGAWAEIGAGAVINHDVGEGEVWCSPGAKRVK